MKTISITYCKPCGYLKRAEIAAALLREKFGIDVNLIAGKGGIFEVAVDKEVVIKRSKVLFPDENAIAKAVGKALKD